MPVSPVRSAEIGSHGLVPFLDLRPSNAPIRQLLIEDIARVMDAGTFLNGPEVAGFETEFAAYCGTETCVGVASGLDALRLALIAAGVERGDEVIVPATTFVATFEAVSQVGAVPVPVDISVSDLNIDVEAATAAVTPATRVILPVHLYGQMADVLGLRLAAHRNDLMILEDACQAHGAERDGLRAGSAGDAAAFSFYPGKNLGAMGDAGALVTDELELARVVRALREHGQHVKYEHALQGYTARLDTIQAAVLLRKLPLLDEWNRSRTAAAHLYRELLDGLGDLHLPPVPPGSVPVWHLFTVRTAHREELESFLREAGIGTGRHYPCPPHLCPAYTYLGYTRGAFPVTEVIASESLSLPLYPGISTGQVETVCSVIEAFFARR
jgi:dTDP-3-amino-3,4,6-trideoxy-alpha-D-glucose transaminase